MLSAMKVSYEDPDYHRRHRVRSAGLRVPSVRQAGRRHAGVAQRDHARRSRQASTSAGSAPNNAILAIVGDVTPEEAFAGAERAFGNWAQAPRCRPTDAGGRAAADAPRRRRRPSGRGADRDPRRATSALPRKHTDYLALDLAIKILGGEGGNRLHRVLRSERGLTYGASADINALKDTGDIVARPTRGRRRPAEALRLIVDEFWRLQRERVNPRELAGAQAYLTGSFPLTIETPSAIALQVLNAVFFGLDLEELQTFRERVNADHAGRHPARRAAVPAPRSAVDRAGRRRECLRQAAAGGWLRPGRAHPARRSST